MRIKTTVFVVVFKYRNSEDEVCVYASNDEADAAIMEYAIVVYADYELGQVPLTMEKLNDEWDEKDLWDTGYGWLVEARSLEIEVDLSAQGQEASA